MTTLPWYTDQEIDSMCEGLASNAAKVRHLRRQGLAVSRKPNGRPLLMRAHAEMVLSGLQQAQAAIKTEARTGAQPNRAGLVLQFGQRGA